MTTPWIVAYVVLALTVMLLAVIVLGLGYRMSRTLLIVDAKLRAVEFFTLSSSSLGLPLGSTAPSLDGVFGPTTASNDARHDSLILFVKRDCEPCRVLTSDLARHDWKMPELDLFVVVDTDDGYFGESNHWTVVDDTGGTLKSSWDVSGTPAAYVVTAEGMIRGFAIVNTTRDLSKLVETAKQQTFPPSQPVSARSTEALTSSQIGGPA